MASFQNNLHGRHKGQEISQIPNLSLFYYLTKIKIKNNNLRKELETESIRRGGIESLFLLAKAESEEIKHNQKIRKYNEEDERTFQGILEFDNDW